MITNLNLELKGKNINWNFLMNKFSMLQQKLDEDSESSDSESDIEIDGNKITKTGKEEEAEEEKEAGEDKEIRTGKETKTVKETITKSTKISINWNMFCTEICKVIDINSYFNTIYRTNLTEFYRTTRALANMMINHRFCYPYHKSYLPPAKFMHQKLIEKWNQTSPIYVEDDQGKKSVHLNLIDYWSRESISDHFSEVIRMRSKRNNKMFSPEEMWTQKETAHSLITNVLLDKIAYAIIKTTIDKYCSYTNSDDLILKNGGLIKEFCSSNLKFPNSS